MPVMRNITPGLKKLGYGMADKTIHKRIIMSISALEKMGKTHFALTAPGTIGMFSADVGTEGVVSKFDKNIVVNELSVPETVAEAEIIWDSYYASYYGSLETTELRTIIVDTATEVWELLRIKMFGKLTQVLPFQYAPVNAIYRKMIKDAYKSDKNLILLHKMKPKYIKNERTEEYERSGFGDTGFLVQVNANIYHEEDDEFALEIVDCRHNPLLVGEVLSGELCTFPMLAAMVIDGTTPEDWE